MEAANAAAEDTQQHIKRTEKIEGTVQLTRDEYQALKRRAKEETSLADWRVSVPVSSEPHPRRAGTRSSA